MQKSKKACGNLAADSFLSFVKKTGRFLTSDKGFVTVFLIKDYIYPIGTNPYNGQPIGRKPKGEDACEK